MTKKKRETPVKNFLNKPMYEATIGDSMIIHTSMLVITIAINLSLQGYILLLTKKR